MLNSKVIRLRRFALVVICTVFSLTGVGAEVVTLVDGREIICKVVREDENRIWVRTHAALMPINRSQIVTIEAGITDSALMRRLESAEREAKALLSGGEVVAARRRLELELWKLEQELEANDKPSQELLVMRRRLKDLHYAALRNDPNQRRAQEFYEEALGRIDRIDYAGAYELLLKATSLAPDRLDIQFSLAEAAEIVSKPQVAMKAYALILTNDHRSYYAEIARPYLAHLLRYGRRALLEDRPRDALPFYEQITLIEDEKGNDPVNLETFSRRFARRLTQSRLEVMLDIFQYARRRDQIFLAKAAIEEALEFDPDNGDLARNYEIWKFLSLLKRLIEQGMRDDIARLKAETPAWVLEDPEVRSYMSRLEGESSEEMKARVLLDEAEHALAAESYNDAQKFAEAILESFARSISAERAREILAQCRLEISINEAMVKAVALIKEMKIDEAEALLQRMLEIEGIMNARGFAKLDSFARRMEREREAANLWNRAVTTLSQDDIEAGAAYLERLSTEYLETEYGNRAYLWLAENGGRLERRAFIVARMSKGLASIVLDEPVAGRANEDASMTRLRTMSSLESLLQADRPMRQMDWLLAIQVVVPIFLSLFILALLLRKFAWPGGDRFGLKRDEYFEARRFRADPWGSPEEISGSRIDLNGSQEDTALGFADSLFGDPEPSENQVTPSTEDASEAQTMKPEPVERMRSRILSRGDSPPDLD